MDGMVSSRGMMREGRIRDPWARGDEARFAGARRGEQREVH